MLGYNVESFCSQVLNEGLPEIFAIHDETNTKFLEDIMEVFGKPNPEGPPTQRKTSLLEATIKAKSGYVKKVKVQVQFHVSFQNNRFESDTYFHFVDQDTTPYSFLDPAFTQPFNQKFIEAMKETEEHARKFMEMYYGQPAQSLYSNLGRTCRIQEL